MELVEGDNLSQRIARGAIYLGEALPCSCAASRASAICFAMGNARDGRLLINTILEGTAASPITLLLNWRPEATP